MGPVCSSASTSSTLGGVDDVVVSQGVMIPATELRWRFSRSSGAGGQHVNTSDTRVELSWDLLGSSVLDAAQGGGARGRLGQSLVDGAVTVTASDRRSQLRNRELAAQRLAGLVAAAIAPPPPRRRPTRPTKAAKRRRGEAKRQRSDVKRLRRPPSAE
ncbi:MAG: alternative ribosome rescue aminoacyl-tRNA hydrolase ArfB [Ilumatobacteraceae bacterium]